VIHVEKFDDYIRRWASDHEAEVVSADSVTAFAEVLTSLPWSGVHLDWDALPAVTFDLRIGGVDVAGTRLSHYDEVLAFFGPGKPGVVGRRDTLLAKLDELFWRTPGNRHLCGVERGTDGRLRFAFDALGEFDGGHVLRLCV